MQTQPGLTEIQQPWRLQPFISAVIILAFVRYGLPIIMPDTLPLAVMGGMAGSLIAMIMWTIWSKAKGIERWAPLPLMLLGGAVSVPLLHESVATGMMGMMYPILFFFPLVMAFALWAVFARPLAPRLRRAAMITVILAGCLSATLIRNEGINAGAEADLAFRWSQTDEERFLAQTRELATPAPETTPATMVPAQWPGFRGPQRNGSVSGIRIETDWATTPPTELWRRPLGPAWSSFAVQGNRFYTQEQHGEDEVVACYNLRTGEPIWRHGDPTRFYQAEGGAGPRATPTLANGRVYSLGGTGMLNALDAATGTVIWSRNAAADTGAETPMYGFSSSPLVVDGLVMVTVGQLTAYDAETGDRRWTAESESHSYSSPHLAKFEGVTQVLTLNKDGVQSIDPADGTALWHYAVEGFHMLQPALMGKEIVMSGGERGGMRRFSVSQQADKWTAAETWQSTRFNPYFSDFVVHQDHVYGFDGRIMACIQTSDGQRAWKGGRYGNGQLILLADQNLLLVVTERGDLVLVSATPDQHTELARVPALQGKTWNHPVLADDVLLVRNAKEMVAFQLKRAE